MPHGGVVGTLKNKSFQDRQYNIVFLGSLADEKEILSSIEKLKHEYGDVVDHIVETVLGNVRLDLEAYVESLIGGGDNDNIISGFSILMSQFSVIDTYRRYYKRKKLLEMLAEANIEVSIFGAGWEGLSKKAQMGLYV